MNQVREIRKKALLEQNSGTVEVRSYHSHAYNGATATHTRLVKPKWNPKINWYAGVKKLSEEEKKATTELYVDPENPDNPLSKVLLEHKKEFNLSDEADKLVLEWLLECENIIALDYEEGVNNPKTTFYIYSYEADVQERANRFEVKDKAVSLLNKLTYAQLLKVTRLRGYNKISANHDDLKLFVRELFEDKKNGHAEAEKFIQTLEDRNADIKDFILRAMQHRIIVKAYENNAEHYYYGTSEASRVFLGPTMDSVIKFLTNPAPEYRTIVIEIQTQMGEPIPGTPLPKTEEAEPKKEVEKSKTTRRTTTSTKK